MINVYFLLEFDLPSIFINILPHVIGRRIQQHGDWICVGGTIILFVGSYVHVLEICARCLHPVNNCPWIFWCAQIWDTSVHMSTHPSSPAHDWLRGLCSWSGGKHGEQKPGNIFYPHLHSANVLDMLLFQSGPGEDLYCSIIPFVDGFRCVPKL